VAAPPVRPSEERAAGSASREAAAHSAASAEALTRRTAVDWDSEPGPEAARAEERLSSAPPG